MGYAYAALDVIADPGASAVYGYVFGGNSSGGTLDLCERLATGGAWTTREPMTNARQAAAACAISGKAYVFGGRDSSYLDSVEEYSPTPDTWAAKTAIVDYARQAHAASTIGTKGYLYGGLKSPGGSGNELLDCDEFDASGDSWANKTDMPAPARYNASATTLGSSGFIFGGQSFTAGYQDTDRYSQTADAWSSKTDMVLPARSLMSCFRVGEAAYLSGGYDLAEAEVVPDCDKYVLDTWSTTEGIPLVDRYGAAAFTIGENGYVAGGKPTANTYLNDCDKYDPSKQAWSNHSTFAGVGRRRPAGCSI